MLIPHDRFARKKGNSKYGKSEKAQRRREGEASGLPGQRLRPKAISEEIGYGLATVYREPIRGSAVRDEAERRRRRQADAVRRQGRPREEPRAGEVRLPQGQIPRRPGSGDRGLRVRQREFVRQGRQGVPGRPWRP